MGPEVGRMQARDKNREFTACDKCHGKIYGSGRMRAKQEAVCGQHKATLGIRHALERSADVKDA